ncbi:PEP-CTERM sorting domain-containing protein [Roseobacter ponti]|uniref:VPLPA-CTERM sorting domain-containing protein n=1 Tax=Roseobacter ponti TaxID=1891787 RepID=A0A858SVK5_9RHOB|nr:PEP-CTERM sorting domain-containing protein [Roseobacter ponti]QJF52725.1 VPLPA-CTERM sorting domain-containing protein [Roseobacter ponti]
MFRGLLSVVAAAGLWTGASQAATFNGETVTIFQYFEDNLPHQREWGKREVAAGEGIFLEFYTIDLLHDLVRLTLDENRFFLQNRGRNGLVIQDTYDLLPAFGSLTIFQNGFDREPAVTVSENELIFDFSEAGDNIAVSATWAVQAVPLPATLPLMLAGFGVAGVMLRRRRKS